MTKSSSLSVRIPVGSDWIEGDLTVVEKMRGIILFAHGSGSSRFSPRNCYVAKVLQEKGFGTLLLDLLTKEEEAVDVLTTEYRFDIDLLAKRLKVATEWIREKHSSYLVAYFGASTGAAAALMAADDKVFAIVSRGGRPDLAHKFLLQVTSPTLLIVGGDDIEVIHLNQIALDKLPCEKKLTIVPNATHLFEEPGALEKVATLTAEWLSDHVLN